MNVHARPIVAEVPPRSVARSDCGAVRTINEDRVLDRPADGLWAVADGMGGHTRGAIAAQLVVDLLAGVERSGVAYTDLDRVCDALRVANRDLVARAIAARDHAVCGATVATLLLQDRHYACVWAGDSRIYRLHRGHLTQLTRDHSVVQALLDAGLIDADEAVRHPQANLVTRAIGVVDPLDLELVHGAFDPGDRFLLCSDGLTRVMTDKEIGIALAAPDLSDAADRLLDAALAAGAPDNISLVAIAP